MCSSALSHQSVNIFFFPICSLANFPAKFFHLSILPFIHTYRIHSVFPSLSAIKYWYHTRTHKLHSEPGSTRPHGVYKTLIQYTSYPPLNNRILSLANSVNRKARYSFRPVISHKRKMKQKKSTNTNYRVDRHTSDSGIQPQGVISFPKRPFRGLANQIVSEKTIIKRAMLKGHFFIRKP
jgi:hypothetical protein